MSWLPVVCLGLAWCVGLFVGVRLLRRIQHRHAHLKRYHVWLLVFMLAAMGPGAVMLWMGGQPVPAAAAGVAILAMAFTALRPARERDFRADFAHDPTHCGRCGYDLHGSESDTCPECGWLIPTSLTRLERRDWMLWWNGWEISYLEDWRRTRRSLALIWLMFTTGIVLALTAWPQGRMAAVLFGFMALHFTINLVRVGQYARQESARRP